MSVRVRFKSCDCFPSAAHRILRMSPHYTEREGTSDAAAASEREGGNANRRCSMASALPYSAFFRGSLFACFSQLDTVPCRYLPW